jgi:hypothetical protein
VARLAQLFASTDAATVLNGPSRPLTVPYRRLMDAPIPRATEVRRQP